MEEVCEGRGGVQRAAGPVLPAGSSSVVYRFEVYHGECNNTRLNLLTYLTRGRAGLASTEGEPEEREVAACLRPSAAVGSWAG